MAEVRRQGDGSQAGGEEFEHSNMQIGQPLGGDRYVPIQTVAESTNAGWRAVGGGVGRHNKFHQEVVGGCAITSPEHDGDWCPTCSHQQSSVPPQLFRLKAIWSDDRRWPLMADT
jgi:hypothetical protein